jgi:hypothetical protein
MNIRRYPTLPRDVTPGHGEPRSARLDSARLIVGIVNLLVNAARLILQSAHWW